MAAHARLRRDAVRPPAAAVPMMWSALAVLAIPYVMALNRAVRTAPAAEVMRAHLPFLLPATLAMAVVFV